MNDDYSPSRYVSRISPIPLLLIHGTADKIIPYSHAEQLFRLAGEPQTSDHGGGRRTYKPLRHAMDRPIKTKPPALPGSSTERHSQIRAR